MKLKLGQGLRRGLEVDKSKDKDSAKLGEPTVLFVKRQVRNSFY